jgi:putative transposase
MVAFIDDHRGLYGVEPICRVLPIAPSTYYAHKLQQAKPERRAPRSLRDEALRDRIREAWSENFEVYGIRKMWRELKRRGETVARCTVYRLMRQIGLQGAVRGRGYVATTIPTTRP